MKGLLLTAFSLFLLGVTNANAQDDEEGPSRDHSALDGSPVGDHHHHSMDRPWCSKSTFALSPFQYTENGVGVGLSFEHALDPDGIISLYVPVIATFNMKDRDNNNGPYYYNTYDPYNTNYNNRNNNNVMFYAMPGVKFYPTGMGRVKYAVGPSLVAGWGQKAMYSYDYYYYTPTTYDPATSYVAPTVTYGVYDRFLLGMMINNSLNVNATPHLYVGAEMGFGFTYFDRVYMKNTSVGDVVTNDGVRFLTQGSFKIGYTF